MNGKATYEVGQPVATEQAWSVWPTIHPYAIVAEGCMVIRNRLGGSDYLTYRTERGAQAVLGEVLRFVPHARIATREDTYQPVPPIEDRRVGLDA